MVCGSHRPAHHPAKEREGDVGASESQARGGPFSRSRRHTLRLRHLGLMAATLITLGVAIACEPRDAFAGLAFPFDGQITPSTGSFGSFEADSVAIDDSNGHMYASDSSSGTIDIFEASSGTQVGSLDGTLTPAGSLGGGEVAVAANNATGDVYVVDSTDNVIDEFDAAGNYVCQITGSATPSASECNGPAGSKTPSEHFSTPSGIAVDQGTGEVYVVDARDGVIDLFSPAGAYLSQILLSSVPEGFSEGETRGIAVSHFNDHVYVADAGRDLVYEFDATGNYVTTWAGANTPAGSFGGGYVSVAADDASGDVLVTDSTNALVDVFEPSGTYITQFGHSFNSVHSVSVDQATHKVYVADNNEPSVLDVFGPPLVIPDVTTGSASEIQPTSADLNGTVNPDGVEVTDCHFDYGTTTLYGRSAPCVETVGAGTGVVAVHAGISSLQAGTTYHFHLEASSANGTGMGEDASFSTPPPPSINNAAATNVTANSADLNAQINPNGFDTTYHFEWGTTTAYGTDVPVPDANIGAGTSDVPVTTHLVGLSPGITYHWRIVARDQNGTALASEADHTFVYDITGATLPDNRAYEMVTPPDKNGALIGTVLIGLAPDVSENGSRVIVDSIQCFAEPTACNGARQNEGEPYALSRTSNGWQATPLAPPATQFASNTPWDVNADAGNALFSMPSPPAGEDDFYARRPDGSFADIGPASPPSAGALGVQPFAAKFLVATAGLSRVIWESIPIWPFDTGSENSIYEYSGERNSAPDLVGVTGGHGSTDLISTCGTKIGGSGSLSTQAYDSLSADGRAIFFTALACASGSGSNAGQPVPADSLYARIDGSQSVLISGRSPEDCTTPACLSSTPAHSEFNGASADGSKVFFTSTQQLTNAATEDEQGGDTSRECSHTTGANGCNLYEYDFANSAGHNLLAVSAGDTSGHGPRVQGVMAISPDGSHVYFVAKGVLTGIANSQGQRPQDGANNLYVFERDPSSAEGHIAFIAALPSSDENEWINGVGEANITPDGLFLVFTSHGTLTSDDFRTDGAQQVFEYDAQSGELLRISTGEQGFNDNGNAGAGNASIVPAEKTYFRNGPPRPDPTMSHDGAYVFFQSPVGLAPHALNDVPIDSNGDLAQNVYEWHEGHVYLISDGKDVTRTTGTSSVQLLGSDATGADVFFRTADQLVPQDTDTQDDYYDARICSAASPCISPPSPPAPPCQDGACQGLPSAPPAEPGGGSATFTGLGNLLPTGNAPQARVVAHSVGHGDKFLVIATVSAKGRIRIAGKGINTVARTVGRPGTYRLPVSLTRRARTSLRQRRKLTLRLRISFTPAESAPHTTDLSVKVKR